MDFRSRILPVAAAVAWLATGAIAAQAQGGPGGGGGGFQMSPAAQSKMQAFRKFGESHPNYRTLSGTLRAIVEMDKEAATKLTPAQAKKMLSVVQPWAAKKTMKDDDAKAVNKKLTDTLTLTQIKKMASLAAQRGGRGGGGGGGRGPGGGGPGGGGGGGFGGGGGGFGGGGRGPGGGGPGGGGGGRGPGGGGGRGGFDMSKMPDPKEYSLLNPASYPGASTQFGQRRTRSVTEFLALVKQRASGK